MVVLVRTVQSQLQSRVFLHSELLVGFPSVLQLLVGFPSALQLHPQLKERLVVGLEHQREVCPGEL